MNGDKIGYPIYRMNEIHNMMCDLNVDKYADISKDEFEKFKLNDRDVLFNRTNSYEWVGRTGIYRKTNKREFIFASYLVRFVPDEKIINPEYLTAYLNTKYGEREIKRRARRSINQTNVNPEEVKEIYIPLLCKKIQNFIKNVFSKAHAYRLKSDDMINSAKTLLLETIGLKKFTPNAKAICVKNFKNSYHQTGRLDAEYYQKKYHDIESHIKHHNRWDSLANLIIHIDTGEYSPEYFRKNEIEGLTFYIRSTNIKCGQIEFDDNYYVKKKNFVRMAKKGGIITARVGSLGVFGEIRDELNGAIYSDNVLCFYLPDYYIPSVYTLLFNSKFFFEMIDRLARGSVQQRLNQETLKDLIIPLIDYDKQRQISVLIEESFALKVKSKRLLNVAKRAVEIAIEQDEETATKWIQEQLNTNE